jgi:hypothetical protein
MADLSKIILPDNAEYNIKDETARTHIADTSNPHGVTAEQVRIFYGTSTSVVSSPQEGDICLVYTA